MKNKIKYILLGFCMLFLVYQGISSVMGYLTDQEVKNNYIQIGYNESKIIEDFPDGSLKPGSTITKKVAVKNTGPVDCFVRVFVGLSDANLETDGTITLNYNTKDWVKKDSWWYYKKSIIPGESTTNLITTVKASSDYDKSAFDIIVYEETAQAKNALTGANYTSAYDAFAAIN